VNLLDKLQQLFPDSSKTTLRTMLKNDRVRVNGQPERDAKRELGDDDRVDVASQATRLDPRIRILYEDADLIVIDKAEHLLSVPTDEVRHENAEALLSMTRASRLSSDCDTPAFVRGRPHGATSCRQSSHDIQLRLRRDCSQPGDFGKTRSACSRRRSGLRAPA
jgi:hypothetical protein